MYELQEIIKEKSELRLKELEEQNKEMQITEEKGKKIFRKNE